MAGAKTITPSGLQVPPRPWDASASAVAGPPDTLNRFSLPAAKKPIDSLSGDQNGYVPFSDPASG